MVETEAHRTEGRDADDDRFGDAGGEVDGPFQDLHAADGSPHGELDPGDPEGVEQQRLGARTMSAIVTIGKSSP